MEILKADISDAEEILALQKLAYRSEAELYNDYEIPPLTQTLEEINAELESHVFLKLLSGGKIMGTVRAYEENGTCCIGRLAVHPEMQNQGFGTALLKEIEKYFECRHFELFTGSRSDRNIHLYKKHGYRIARTSRFGCGNIELLHMEKSVDI